MKVSQAAEIWMNYHQVQSKRNTVRAYRTVITKFCAEFGNADLGDLTPDDVLSFLNRWTQHSKPQTKRIRYAYLSSFFNFVRDNMDSGFIQNFQISHAGGQFHLIFCLALRYILIQIWSLDLSTGPGANVGLVMRFGPLFQARFLFRFSFLIVDLPNLLPQEADHGSGQIQA